jgi:NAD(P)H dehydrogenase (quinone)
MKSSSPVFALTGACGHLGRLVLDYLVKEVPAGQIVAATRTPGLLKDYREKGIDVRYADFNNPKSLPAAFSGAERLLIISSNEYPWEKRHSQKRNAVAKAIGTGVRHIILTGGLPDSINNSEIYEMTESAGVGLTELRMNIWMDGVRYFLGALHKGDTLLVPEGSGGPCWINHEDYARIAVSVLTGKFSIKGQADVTGPESLGLAALAGRWSKVNDRKLDAVFMPDKEVIETLTECGMTIETAQGIVSYCGMFKMFEWPVSDFVERATGKKPCTVDNILSGFMLE